MLLVALPAVLLGASLGLGKIVRDCSLTCNVGFRLAPLGILAVAVAIAPIAALRTRLEARWGYRRWHVASTLFAAASFLLFRLLTNFLQASLSAAVPAETGVWLAALRWTYLAFFVWLGAISVVLGANAFGHVHAALPASARERAIGFVAAGAVLGALGGSWLAGRWAAWLLGQGWRYEVVRDNLMIAMAAILLLKAAVLPFVRPRERDPVASPPEARQRIDLRQAFAWIRSDPSLLGLAALILVTGVADTMLKYLFYWFVSERTSAHGGRTLYFAGFYVWVNAATLFMMAFGTGRIIRRYGLRLALLLLPTALVFGTLSLVVSLAVAVMYVMRVVESALRSAFYEPSIERLYLRMPEDRFAVLRPVLSGLMGRLGEGLGAALVMLLVLALQPPLRAMVGFYLVLLLIWAGVVLGVWRRMKPAAVR
jgi:AAA family ATP:ADP antiporter